MHWRDVARTSMDFGIELGGASRRDIFASNLASEAYTRSAVILRWPRVREHRGLGRSVIYRMMPSGHCNRSNSGGSTWCALWASAPTRQPPKRSRGSVPIRAWSEYSEPAAASTRIAILDVIVVVAAFRSRSYQSVEYVLRHAAEIVGVALSKGDLHATGMGVIADGHYGGRAHSNHLHDMPRLLD